MSRNRTFTAFVFASISFTIPHVLPAQTLVCPEKHWVNISTDPEYPSLKDIHGVSSQSVFVVGAGGTILHFNGVDWIPMTSGTQTDLVGVWAEGDNDVYAVGSGILLHYDGASWSEVAGPVSGRASDVMVSSGSVYIAAVSSVQELTGGTWSITQFPCASGEWWDECDEIYALTPHPQGGWIGVGSRAIWYDYVDEKYGLIYENGVFSRQSTPGWFTDVWASADELYIVHRPIYSSGQKIYYTAGGTTLAPMPEQPTASVMNIFGETKPFGVMEDGRLTWYDGAAWLETTDGAGAGYGEVWGTSPGDIFGVGGTYIYRYDGADFSVHGGDGGPGNFALVDAWVDENQDLWAVGNTKLYRYDGAQWQSEVTAPSKINAMWGRASDDIYVVDDGGNVIHYDGAGQTTVGLDADRLWDITESPVGDIYAVGEKGDGRVFRYDGSAWTLFQSGLSTACTAVLGIRKFGYPDYLMVGTSEGEVFRYDGGWVKYSNVFSPNDPTRILDLWGMSHDRVLVAGDAPLIASINMVTQSVVTVYETPAKVSRLWGINASNVWGAGSDGSVLHFDGSTWFTDANTGATQFGVAGAGACDVYLVGDHGNVWHLEPPGPRTTMYMSTIRPDGEGRGYPWRITPGEQMCAQAYVNPSRHSITMLLDVQGTTQTSDVIVTGSSGGVDFCYMPDHPGVDTVTARVQIGPGEYATYQRVVETIPEILYLRDPQGGYSNGDIVHIVPPAEVCASFRFARPEAGINIDFTVSGTNTASGSNTTDYQGRVVNCYTAASTGVDTIVATVTHMFPAGPVTSSRSVYINLVAPDVQVSFDGQYNDDADSVRTVLGDDVCVNIRTVPPWPDAQIGLTVTGANAQNSMITTDNGGRATWCYTPMSYGVDTVRVSGATLVLTVLPPFIALSSTTGSTTVTVAPGGGVCSTIETVPELPGVEIRMEVHGSNTVVGTVTTSDPGGNATWCYTPTGLGVDTLTAMLGDTTAADSHMLVLLLQQPQIAIDPSYNTGVNSVLAAPGGELCARFVLDHAVADQQFDFIVAGTNSQVYSETKSGNAISYCYTAESLGADTVSTTARFDYGGGVYRSTKSLFLLSYAPEFAADSTYQVSYDTLLTYADGTACARFVTTPPLERVNVTCRVTGANTTDVVGWSDELGRALVCYPAPNEGIDSLSATAHFVINGTPYQAAAGVVVTVLQGSAARPVVTMTASTVRAEDYHVQFDVRSDRELANPSAMFEFERSDGYRSAHVVDFAYVDDTDWTYRNSYWIEADGHVEVWFLAKDLYGNATQARASLEVGRVDELGGALDYRTNDGYLRLNTPFGAIQRSGALLIHGEAVPDPSPTDGNGDALVPVSDAYSIMTSALLMTSPTLTLWHSYQVGTLPSPDNDPRKVGIYRLDDSHWTHVGGSGQQSTLATAVALPGTYAAFYNASYHVVPAQTVLFQNYPNPFNPTTTITFTLPEKTHANLSVYNIEGKLVATLVDEPLDEGFQEATWGGKDANGNPVSSGVYFYRLKAGNKVLTRKMVLLK